MQTWPASFRLAWTRLCASTAAAVTLVSATAQGGALPDGQSLAPTQGNAAEAEDHEAPPLLTGAELRNMMADVNVFSSPDPVRITVLLGLRYPYQPVGVGAVLDLYPTPWLRMSATYSLGLTAIANPNDGVKFCNYAEASVAVAPFLFHDETTVDVSYLDPATDQPGKLKALVPTYHGAFVEGGGMTGFISPARCIDHCDEPSASDRDLVSEDTQLFMFFAGLRYVYFHGLSSERFRFAKRAHTEIFVHLITKPVNPPDHPVESWTNGEPIESAPYGGRIGFETLLFCTKLCVGLGGSGGISPLPRGPMVEFHFTY